MGNDSCVIISSNQSDVMKMIHGKMNWLQWNGNTPTDWIIDAELSIFTLFVYELLIHCDQLK